MKDVIIVGKDKFYKFGNNTKIFYYGGVNKSFGISSIQIYKENEDSIGFCMYDESSYNKAIECAIKSNNNNNTNDKGVIKIYMLDNLHTYNVPNSKIIELTKEQLRDLKNLEYDMIKGKINDDNIYILLNKSKVVNIEFMNLEQCLDNIDNEELNRIKENILNQKTK